MPHLRSYHIMISHAWDYSSDYQTIKRWLNEASYFTWSDYSVPIDRPLNVNSTRELKERLRNRISNCSCIIVLAGMYSAYSDWIDFEIDTALFFGKPIIGVLPRGQQRVPRKISENAKEMVGWRSSSVVNAVRSYAIPR